MRRAFSESVILLGLSTFLFCSMNLNAFYAGNESECAFLGECDNKGDSTARTASNCPSLSQFIAEGGSHFLQSLSDIHHLLGLMESSKGNGIDYKAFQDAVNAAISNMRSAQATYFQLKSQAAVIPYNQEVINRLIEFDYNSFQIEAGFIPAIFTHVQMYLVTGDVRGVYKQFYENAGDILERLETIKVDVDTSIFPNLVLLWRLNQKCSEYKLFGQYVSEVFYKIK
jgi:hypothetical protein